MAKVLCLHQRAKGIAITRFILSWGRLSALRAFGHPRSLSILHVIAVARPYFPASFIGPDLVRFGAVV